MSIVPSNLQYTSGGRPIAIASSRRTVKVIPEAGSSSYNPQTNNTIRIDLSPSLGFLDVHNSYLTFRVKPVADTLQTHKPCRLDKNSMSWVRRFTVHSSTGSILEDIDHYNLVVNLLHQTTGGPEYKKTIGSMIDNQGSKAARNAAMANPAGAMFNSGFDASGILSGGSDKLIPLSFLQGPLTIELSLADMKECFVCTAKDSSTTPNYEITNVEYHASVLSMSEEYNARFAAQLRSRGVDMSFETVKVHIATLSSGDVDLPISQNSASVKGSYHILRSKRVITSTEEDSLSTYKSGNLEEIQWDLGGQLYPQFPLKLKDDACTNVYSHNLLAWNQFRNHALSTSVDETNFASSEPSKVPVGSYSATDGYKALPIRRIYGTFVANGKDMFQDAHSGTLSTNAIATGTDAGEIAENADHTSISADDINLLKEARTIAAPQMVFDTDEVVAGLTLADTAGETDLVKAGKRTCNITHTIPTMHFVPYDPQDLALVTQGLRCKLGAREAPHGEASATSDVTIRGFGERDGKSYGGFSNLDTTESPPGLDRFFRSQPAAAPSGTAAENNLFITENYKHGSGTVMYAGSPSAFAWGYEKSAVVGSLLAGRQLAGIGIPLVDGMNRPILSKRKLAIFEGWLDVVPDDSSFYVGNSFETHMESQELISGSDLTNATPLHVRLKYASHLAADASTDADNFFEDLSASDQLCSMVHIDAVLRVQPDGTVISSV